MTNAERLLRSRDRASLAALMLGYSVLFLTYYPPLAGIEDEVGFINQALVFSRGAVSAEGAGYADLDDFGLINGWHVSMRNPGRSLVAIPFLMAGGLRALFVSGLVLHLAMTATGAALLARLGKSPLWAALLLFHPTLAIYSRTIMADGAAGAGLLLAGLFMTVSGAASAIGAGLSVGLAALMRYHAGLALPLAVAAIVLDRDRPRRYRDALLCLAAGATVGLLIVAYNLAVYGTALNPFTSRKGYFSKEFLLPHGLFYAGALMTIWPFMLPAPVLDRSRLRWLIRGVCGFFIASAIFYYFHDRGKSWLETAVLGQRLIQVALPLWVVSYSVVIDERVVAPSRRWVQGRAGMVLTATTCVGLLAANGLAFRNHQQHLNRLLAAREAAAAAIPSGSLVVVHGGLRKLFGIPVGVPKYRWRMLAFERTVLARPGDEVIGRERSPWFLAVLGEGQRLPEQARALIHHYHMVPVPTREPHLVLYMALGLRKPASGQHADLKSTRREAVPRPSTTVTSQCQKHRKLARETAS
jgi:hypothetical protein